MTYSLVKNILIQWIFVPYGCKRAHQIFELPKFNWCNSANQALP